MTLFLIYGSLALFTIAATWPERDLRWIGLALGFSFGMSNLAWAFGDIENRVGIYTMCEIFVALAAYMAWEDLRYRALPALGMVCAISITANIAFALQPHPKWAQIHTYELITNLCFALECLVASGMGIAHGVGTGRFGVWSRDRDEVGQSHGVRSREQ